MSALTYLLAAVLSAAPAPAPAPAPAATPAKAQPKAFVHLPGVKPDIEFAVVGGERLTLDAFVPAGEGPFPTCILVHGGGFVRGDKHSYIAPLFEPLCKAGFTWFTIDYRLAPKHKWPACGDDVATAVKWVRADAKEYKVDPARIAIIGESAGGHLVSWAGAVGEGDSAVAAVVAFYAPNDLELQVKGRDNKPGSMKDLLGVETIDDKTLPILRAASPITKVRKGLPPFLLIHGDADKTVPHEQSTKFQSRMKEAGNVCDLITVVGGGHGMGGWAKLEPAYREEMIAWLRKTLGAPAPK